MICKTILFSALLFSGAFLYAQQMSLGLRAGYTLSDVFVKEPDNLVVEGIPANQVDEHFRTLSSYHIGIDARQPFSKRVGIVASLLYARKGYVGTSNWTGSQSEAAWHLYYLNLALVTDVLLWKGFSLQTGVEAGWLADTRVKTGGTTYDPQKLYQTINDFDFGLVCGLEYRFNTGFFISARHIFGVTPLQSYDVADRTGTSLGYITSRNSATQISLGYRHLIGE